MQNKHPVRLYSGQVLHSVNACPLSNLFRVFFFLCSFPSYTSCSTINWGKWPGKTNLLPVLVVQWQTRFLCAIISPSASHLSVFVTISVISLKPLHCSQSLLYFRMLCWSSRSRPCENGTWCLKSLWYSAAVPKLQRIWLIFVILPLHCGHLKLFKERNRRDV